MSNIYLRNNKNIFNYIKDKSELLYNKVIKKLETKENNKYGNKIKNMIKQHSFKYHPKEEINKSLKYEFDKMLQKLKYGKYDYNNNNNEREIKYIDKECHLDIDFLN